MAAQKKAKDKNRLAQGLIYTIGVLADTHIPDRVNELHPLLLSTLQASEVTHIFHAGDICSPGVLNDLKEIAPVTAVRGNRDWFVPDLPMVAKVELGGISFAVMHGHGGIARYLLDKVKFMFDGYNLRRYMNLLTHTLPEANVVVFGHTHYPEIVWTDEKLLFNPGSASFGSRRNRFPSIGILRIYENGEIKPSLRYLKGYKVIKRHWVSKKDLLPIT